MRLIFAPLAVADLEEIGDYIALDNPPRALSFIRELRAQCRKILDNPLAFPAREDLAPGLRVLPYGQYLIFYRPMDTTVRIERILHGARDVGTQFTTSKKTTSHARSTTTIHPRPGTRGVESPRVSRCSTSIP